MSDDDYEIGYGRPPVSHQWIKGQSGNRQGKKRASSLDDDIREVFGAPLEAREGSKRVRITATAAIYRKMCLRALRGDKTALREAINLMIRFDDWAKKANGGEAEPDYGRMLRDRIESIAERKRREGHVPVPRTTPIILKGTPEYRELEREISEAAGIPLKRRRRRPAKD